MPSLLHFLHFALIYCHSLVRHLSHSMHVLLDVLCILMPQEIVFFFFLPDFIFSLPFIDIYFFRFLDSLHIVLWFEKRGRWRRKTEGEGKKHYSVAGDVNMDNDNCTAAQWPWHSEPWNGIDRWFGNGKPGFVLFKVYTFFQESMKFMIWLPPWTVLVINLPQMCGMKTFNCLCLVMDTDCLWLKDHTKMHTRITRSTFTR